MLVLYGLVRILDRRYLGADYGENCVHCHALLLQIWSGRRVKAVIEVFYCANLPYVCSERYLWTMSLSSKQQDMSDNNRMPYVKIDDIVETRERSLPALL